MNPAECFILVVSGPSNETRSSSAILCTNGEHHATNSPPLGCAGTVCPRDRGAERRTSIAGIGFSCYVLDSMSAQTALEDTRRLVELFRSTLRAPIEITEAEDGLMQALCLKLISHAATTIRLAEEPTRMPSGEGQFTDVGSNYALARTAYETALVLHFVFLVPVSVVSPGKRWLRFLRWDLAGYVQTEEWAAIQPENAKRKQEYVKIACQIRDSIRKHAEFLKLPEKKQRGMGRVPTQGDVLKGKAWKEEAWWELAAEMGIKQGHFRPSYAFLSAWAHSDSLSAGQLSNMPEPARRVMASVALHHLAVPLAKTILAYAARFPHARAVLEKNPEDVAFVDTLASFADIDLTEPKASAAESSET